MVNVKRLIREIEWEVSKPPIVPDKNRNSSNLYESSDEIEIDQIRLSNPKFP